MGEEVIGASSWRKMLRAGWERSPRWLSATPGETETNENTDRSDGRIGYMGRLGERRPRIENANTRMVSP